MDVIENIKSYFNKKENNEITGPVPEGVCPNCWGRHEWDGEYYKFIKGQKDNPDKETYDNFIKKVVRMLGKVRIEKNSYYCETCHVNFERNN
jgi:hypothetical protein